MQFLILRASHVISEQGLHLDANGLHGVLSFSTPKNQAPTAKFFSQASLLLLKLDSKSLL